MSNEMLQKAIDLVSSLEVKNETQQIAKYELIEYTERLHKENQELKKQLEKKYEKVGTLTGELLYEENTKLINQQKEFIEWLEKEIQGQEDYAVSLGLTIDYGIAEYTSGKIDALKESLSKYKELVGYKDDE